MKKTVLLSMLLLTGAVSSVKTDAILRVYTEYVRPDTTNYVMPGPGYYTTTPDPTRVYSNRTVTP